MKFISLSASFPVSASLLSALLLAPGARGDEPRPTVQSIGPDLVRVSWQTLSGSTYVFSVSDGLKSPAWLAPDGPVAGTGAILTRDFSTAGGGKGFFRLSFTDQPFTTAGDFDGDGIPTTWEIARGHDPLDAASGGFDHDLDGLNALAEYRGGTEPDAADPSGRSYIYDAKGQLVRAVYPGGNAIVYSYDAAGNLLTVAVETP